MNEFIENIGLVLLVTLGLPELFTWLLTITNRRTNANLIARFGINSQVYCGFLGIMIHELSHLVIALLFRHRISSFRLVKLPHLKAKNGDEPDLALGYVYHVWNHRSPYQLIGNFFIGMAPIFGCTAVLLVLDQLLAPGLAKAIFELADTPTAPNWAASWQALTTTHVSWWQLLLLLVLTITIVVGGLELSSADYQNQAIGLYSMIALLIVVTTIFTLLGITGWIHHLVMAGLTIAMILSYSLIVSLLIMLGTNLFTRRHR
ncbi:hypothetical protein [Lactiplantibacillus herbarum]|uniref:hypothetical protein n=1 Tax=Lactiplantibacillus herbarum TaxID=1670446 RepID=UPI00064ECECD|nr:hypothetical protein [Lactiplantibacillus herbarum]